MRPPPLLLAYVGLHTLLYCSLLPLWEGYDEPFHYGYIQYLIHHGEPPVLDRSKISVEVWESMRLAPTSYLSARNMPGLTPYADFHRLPEAERAARKARLRSLSPQLRTIEAGPDNYEAQQPPLAYMALAPLDWAAAASPLPSRIWLLRVLAAAVSVALLLWVVFALGHDSNMPAPYVTGAAFVLVSIQNLYGTVAHVASDWLAVPMIPVLMLAGARLWRCRDLTTTALLAAALAIGLLSKSYFLVFVPFALFLAARAGPKPAALFAAIIAVASPWYVRNWLLYGNFTGLQSAVSHVETADVARSFLNIPWFTTLPGMFRGFLWTANNSFTTFSVATLNLVLALLVAGYVLRALTLRRSRLADAEISMAAGTALFIPVLLYALALFGVLYPSPVPNANAWYGAGLLPAIVLLAFSGFSRHPIGRWGALALFGITVHVVGATYFVKLIPMYAGFEGRIRPAALLGIYGSGMTELIRRLNYVTPLDGAVVLALAVLVVSLATALSIQNGRQLY